MTNKKTQRLDERKRKFCQEYHKTGNLYQSAIKAGYSAKYAKGRASYLLDIVCVSEYLEKLAKKAEDEAIANIIEVKKFWTSAMRSEREETKDRLKASEYIARTTGAFTDNVNANTTIKLNNPFSDLTSVELKKLINDD